MEPTPGAAADAGGCGTGLNRCDVREFQHQSVMLAEALEALAPRSGACYFDGTCGGGGHSEALLEASSPDGTLKACDRDWEALAAAGRRLARFGNRFELRHGNFCDAGDWVPAGSCEGVLLDLGTSSHQLTSEHRGFSFQHEQAPLDMRMDTRARLTAAEILNQWPEAELATLFWENGERHSRRIARTIAAERKNRPFVTTGQLTTLVCRVAPAPGQRTHPATKVFQGLRLAVNGEIDSLERGLRTGMKLLKPGGILAVISFHSGEDRVVKDFMRNECRDYDVPAGEEDLPHLRQPRPARAELIFRKAKEPSEAEIAANPRARSARLRVLRKL